MTEAAYKCKKCDNVLFTSRNMDALRTCDRGRPYCDGDRLNPTSNMKGVN
jgi:hypothetical protein